MISADDLRAAAPPEVQAVMQQLRAARQGGAGRAIDPLAMQAADMASAAWFNHGEPATPEAREVTIPAGGGVRALVFAPDGGASHGSPVLLYMHGGAFIVWSPEVLAAVTRAIATKSGVVVVSIDYRRAPQHTHPSALDDTVAAYRWLREHAAGVGGDPRRVAIGGDSAGAMLAAGAVHRLRDEGGVPPEAMVLICAWLDMAMDSPSFRALGPDDPLIDDTIMRFARSCYAPDPASWAHPYVSPLLGDVSSLPPACVVAAGLDPLFDEARMFAGRMRAAGRVVALHEHAGMLHDFVLFPTIERRHRATDQIAAFLREHLAG